MQTEQQGDSTLQQRGHWNLQPSVYGTFFFIQWLQQISRGNYEEAQTQLGHQGQHKSLRVDSMEVGSHKKFKSKVKFFLFVHGGR